jgi:hypothetical protein
LLQRLATGWTVRGSNPGEGEIFRICPDRPWGLLSLLYNGYQVFPGGKKRPGRDADPSPPSSVVGNKRVELYLYSPYGTYGLCRASVPAQGCTLAFFVISLCELVGCDAGHVKTEQKWKYEQKNTPGQKALSLSSRLTS